MNENKFALIIGIEKYLEKTISSVLFAENDAKGVLNCLLELGFDSKNITHLLSSQATKTQIEFRIRHLCKTVHENDEILIFFAGHGVAINGANYITCFDTIPSDLANTCITLKWILDLIQSSKSNRVVLFLDSCHSGLEIDDSMRGIFDIFDESEIEAFFADAEYAVGFSSCSSDEYSYSSPNLKHGIWTYHLIKAFRGEVSLALQNKKYITSASLQNYLAKEVPTTLRMEHPNPVVQTPKCFGSFSKEFLLFDLSNLLQRRAAERRAKIKDIKQINLLGFDIGNIRELSGFIKGSHRVPKTIDDYTKSFVERIATKDVENEATEVFNLLRRHLRYKRREIKLELEGSLATIATKDFEFSIFYTQDDDDESSYRIEYEIANIKDSSVLLKKNLQPVLRYFNEVRVSISGKIDIEEIIDMLEENESDNVKISYPPDCSELIIKIDDNDWEVKLTHNSFAVVSSSNKSPATMIEYLIKSQKVLASNSNLLPILEAQQ